MRRKTWISCLIILIIAGCHFSSKKEYKLSDERMAHLMLDLQLADNMLTELNAKQQDTVKILLEKKLQDIYHLTPEDIKKQMALLQTDPVKLKLILNRAKQMADSIQ